MISDVKREIFLEEDVMTALWVRLPQASGIRPGMHCVHKYISSRAVIVLESYVPVCVRHSHNTGYVVHVSQVGMVLSKNNTTTV